MPYKDKNKQREANRRSYHKYKEERLEWSKTYYQKTKSDKAIKSRFSWIRRAYGMSPEDFENLWDAQNGLCAICSIPLGEGYRCHIDHNHATNKIRGLLCKACNNGIGFLKDDPALLRKAAIYIEG
jgi:hypothetical protein